MELKYMDNVYHYIKHYSLSSSYRHLFEFKATEMFVKSNIVTKYKLNIQS